MDLSHQRQSFREHAGCTVAWQRRTTDRRRAMVAPHDALLIGEKIAQEKIETAYNGSV